MLASADDPAFAMPAAGWAAKTGNPLLFVHRSTIPGPTFAALQAHHRPRIYLLAPPAVVGASVEAALRGIGTVTRISAPDPVRSAIAFARLRDGLDGWGIDDPGHGLVFANAGRTLDAAAAAPLSACGTYGPLLLIDDADTLPLPVGQLPARHPAGLHARPGPRGLQSRLADRRRVRDLAPVQSRIDSLLEIAPIQTDTTAIR